MKLISILDWIILRWTVRKYVPLVYKERRLVLPTLVVHNIQYCHMAKKELGKAKLGHVVVVPYPSQGHINPMLQFCKRLSAEGLTTTLAITRFISTSTSAPPPPSSGVRIATISDGCDVSGFEQADGIHDYIHRLEAAGSESLKDLIMRNSASDELLPVTCVVYDALLPWALDVAKALGLVGAAFFTQNCVVNYLYYNAHKGSLELPVACLPVPIPGMPPFSELRDMPSFIQVYGSYPAYFNLLLNQFSNIHKADCFLFNSVYEFEPLVTFFSMTSSFSFPATLFYA